MLALMDTPTVSPSYPDSRRVNSISFSSLVILASVRVRCTPTEEMIKMCNSNLILDNT